MTPHDGSLIDPSEMGEAPVNGSGDCAAYYDDDAPPHTDVGAAAPALGLDAADVLAAWRTEGPLVHEPTGFATLDEATGGGPVFGSRWYMLGAPNAGKTMIVVQWGHVWALRGLAVGLLAVDEEAGDVVTRLAQRVGVSRRACERREEHDLERMRGELSALPFYFYDRRTTIEAAAADVARRARERGTRGVLLLDSLQWVECEAERAAERELAEVQAIGLRVQAIRAAATEHRLIAIATSEMGREYYKTIKRNDRPNALAAAKWSGAVEYSARVLLALTSIKGVPDVVQCEVPKNKHGRDLTGDDEAIYLAIDRATQTVEETERPEMPEDEGREAAREVKQDEQKARDAATLAVVLARDPGIGAREVRAGCRAAAGTMSSDRTDTAIKVLGAAVVKRDGPKRAVLHYLDGGKVPDAVLRLVQGDARHAVLMARPPTDEGADDAA